MNTTQVIQAINVTLSDYLFLCYWESKWALLEPFISSPELAQGELLGYRDVRRPSYVWTSVTSETYETSETSVRQLFSLCTL